MICCFSTHSLPGYQRGWMVTSPQIRFMMIQRTRLHVFSYLMAHNCPQPQLNCCFLRVVPCCHWFCFLFGKQQFRCRRDLGLLRAASVSCLQTHNSSVWTIFTYLFFFACVNTHFDHKRLESSSTSCSKWDLKHLCFLPVFE